MSSSASKGYPTDIFRDIHVSIVKYLCVLCHFVLRNPVQRFCGHRYCRSCIDEANEASAGSDTVCPACVEDDNHEEVPDNTVRQVTLVLLLLSTWVEYITNPNCLYNHSFTLYRMVPRYFSVKFERSESICDMHRCPSLCTTQ